MPELLVFALGEHRFGLPAEAVIEVVRVVDAVPSTEQIGRRLAALMREG